MHRPACSAASSTTGSAPSSTSAWAIRCTVRGFCCCRLASRASARKAISSVGAAPAAYSCLRAVPPRRARAPTRWSHCSARWELFPLTEAAARPATRTVRVGGLPIDTDWPKDVGFFEYLAEGLRHVPVEPTDKLIYA